MVLIRFLIESAVAPTKVSAQSPHCNQNARPSAASAMRFFRLSHSPAKTSGGKLSNSDTADLTAAGSGHAGCWAATSPALNIELALIR